MRNRKKKIIKTRGYVIVLALIAMMTMTFFLMTGAMTTTSTMKVSGNYTKTVDGFNLAEIGLAKARPVMEVTPFNTLLVTYSQADLPLIPKTSFNKGFYEAWVYDNDDGDGNEYVDADDILIVKSIGTNSAGGTVEIEAHLQKPSITPPTLPSDPASGAGAAMLCGTSTDVKIQGSSLLSGHDHLVPDPGCPTSACGGYDCSDPDRVPSGTIYDTTPEEAECDALCGVDTVCPGAKAVVAEGTLNVSGTTESNISPATQDNVGDDTQCDEWRTLRDELASLDESSPHVEVLTGSGTSAELNDCTDPKVFIINTPESSYKFSGDSFVCGMIVVASDTILETVGNSIIVGNVLVMGDSASLSFAATTGTPHIFGQVIVQSTSVDKAKELEMKGTADIAYSTQGIGFGEEAMQNALTGGGGGGGGLITMAWKETY